MRLFCIYNRAYKLRYFLASTIEEALAHAAQVGHIKRPQGFRRWLDATDDPPEELKPYLPSLMKEKRTGVLVQHEQGWNLV